MRIAESTARRPPGVVYSVHMEQEILQLLKTTIGVSYSVKEVSRRLDRKRYQEDPNWARPHLDSLVRQDLIQMDDTRHYLVPKSDKYR